MQVRKKAEAVGFWVPLFCFANWPRAYKLTKAIRAKTCRNRRPRITPCSTNNGPCTNNSRDIRLHFHRRATYEGVGKDNLGGRASRAEHAWPALTLPRDGIFFSIVIGGVSRFIPEGRAFERLACE